jgi:hypothetical protein
VRAVEEREERRDVIRRRRIVVVVRRASSRGRGARPDADARAGVVSG